VETLARTLDWLFPGTCPGCGALAPGRICEKCWAARERFPAVACRGAGGLSETLALGPYRGLWARSLRLLKYHGRKDLAVPLGRELGRAASEAWPDAPQALWVPVPAPAARRRARGYDHARLLAAVAARTVGARAKCDVLRRMKETPPLHGASRDQRETVLRGAFAAGPVRGAVMLVDDILTTGATGRAAATALLDGGAAQVRMVVVARA
jgi:predicted amidophosphoribosyltransferase